MNADPIARWYRWLEYLGFGHALERRRFAFLREVGDARRILVLGEGDGRFLIKLVEQNIHASIDYVDLSERMLQLARERAGDERVVYHHANAIEFALPEAEYDLIVTHFFLDCLSRDEMERLIDNLVRSVRPRARWIVSEFREPAAWAHAMVAMLYMFFRWTTGLRTRVLVDHRPVLERHGFTMLRCETERFGLLTSELWTFSDNKIT